MGKETGIDWTDHTWNPWQGCRKVSVGCENCYMYRDKNRYGHNPGIVIRSKQATFDSPLKWKYPAKVFVCSWSDFFIEDADAWRGKAWNIIRKTPHLTYQILTKRPENIAARLPEDWPFQNVWLGVTAENQEMAEKRIPILLKTKAALRFISVEPMVGPVDISEYLQCKGCGYSNKDMVFHGDHYLCKDKTAILNWVICGGETGTGAREMEAWWAESLKNQCDETNTAFFMKQMTNKKPIPEYLKSREFPVEQVDRRDNGKA